MEITEGEGVSDSGTGKWNTNPWKNTQLNNMLLNTATEPPSWRGGGQSFQY